MTRLLRPQTRSLDHPLSPSSLSPPSQVSFLIEIYGQLEEPDGLGGLVSLRHGGLNHSDQILAAEKSGCWSEALALYEQGMGMTAVAGAGDASAVAEPSAAASSQMPAAAAAAVGSKRTAAVAASAAETGRSIVAPSTAAAAPAALSGGVAAVAGGGGSGVGAMVLGHLRCLLQMGHLTAVLQQVDGLLARGAGGGGGRAQVAAAGVAAAWRMGRWEVLKVGATESRAGSLKSGTSLGRAKAAHVWTAGRQPSSSRAMYTMPVNPPSKPAYIRGTQPLGMGVPVAQ